MFFIFVRYGYFVLRIVIEVVVVSLLKCYVSHYSLQTVGGWFIMNEVDRIDRGSRW